MGQSILGSGIAVAALLYSLVILLWFVSYRLLGDRPWWLALIHSVAPLLFTPTLLFGALGLVVPSAMLWGSLLLPLLIFLILFGQLFMPRGDRGQGAQAHSFTIMTFNIWYLSWTDESAYAILRNGAPDIVALQELQPALAEKIISVCGEHYPYRLLDIGPGAQGLGIISRFPLSRLDVHHLTTADFRVQAAQLTTPGGSLHLYNIHPRATNIARYRREGQSVACATARSFQQRADNVHRLTTAVIRHRGPAIVVGDFNSTPQHTAYTYIAAAMTDAHREAGWGFGHTFPAHRSDVGGVPIPHRQMRLDMIFYTPELRAFNCRVGQFHGDSDHLPVIAQVGWCECPSRGCDENRVSHMK